MLQTRMLLKPACPADCVAESHQILVMRSCLPVSYIACSLGIRRGAFAVHYPEVVCLALACARVRACELSVQCTKKDRPLCARRLDACRESSTVCCSPRTSTLVTAAAQLTDNTRETEYASAPYESEIL